MSRPLSEIAEDILIDWKTINYAAQPYANAMLYLNHVNDMYIAESGRDVVLYFLSNASSWRGPVARRIKKELKAILAA